MFMVTSRWHVCFARGHEVADDLEIADVLGQEWNLVDVRGRRDRQIHRSFARLAAAGAHGGGEPPPLACDFGCDRERIEGRLDRA